MIERVKAIGIIKRFGKSITGFGSKPVWFAKKPHISHVLRT